MNNEYDHDAEPYGEEIEIEAIGIEVNAQPIELYKVMKIANLVSGGGEAKHAISEGYVAVNGELEQRKRRKMYDGDFFEFNQEYYVVIYQPNGESAPQEDEPSVALEDSRAAPSRHDKQSAAQRSKKQGAKAKRSKADHSQGKRGNHAPSAKAISAKSSKPAAQAPGTEVPADPASHKSGGKRKSLDFL